MVFSPSLKLNFSIELYYKIFCLDLDTGDRWWYSYIWYRLLTCRYSFVVPFILHFYCWWILYIQVVWIEILVWPFCHIYFAWFCQRSFGICLSFFFHNLWLQSGIMQTHDEETRKFFKHSSVTCVLSPRYASSKLSIFKQQACFMLWFSSFTGLCHVSVKNFPILYHSFHAFIISL